MVRVVLIIQRLDERREKNKVIETNEIAGYNNVKRVVFVILDSKNKCNRECRKGFVLKFSFVHSIQAKQISIVL